MKEIVYLVSYSEGSYDDFYQIELFFTDNIDKAKDYVKKFNSKLKYWKDYFEKIDIEEKDVANYSRYYSISEINCAYFTEIEKR